MNQLETKLQGITVFDEVAELRKENELLKQTFREIKKHQTACNALKVALARIKEMEDE